LYQLSPDRGCRGRYILSWKAMAGPCQNRVLELLYGPPYKTGRLARLEQAPRTTDRLLCGIRFQGPRGPYWEKGGLGQAIGPGAGQGLYRGEHIGGNRWLEPK